MARPSSYGIPGHVEMQACGSAWPAVCVAVAKTYRLPDSVFVRSSSNRSCTSRCIVVETPKTLRITIPRNNAIIPPSIRSIKYKATEMLHATIIRIIANRCRDRLFSRREINALRRVGSNVFATASSTISLVVLMIFTGRPGVVTACRQSAPISGLRWSCSFSFQVSAGRQLICRDLCVRSMR